MRLKPQALILKHHVTLNEVKGLSRETSDRLGLKDPSQAKGMTVCLRLNARRSEWLPVIRFGMSGAR